MCKIRFYFFFFQAEDGIRDGHVTGVHTCALPISTSRISDLQKAAAIVEGKQVNDKVRAIVVPGSYSIKMQAEKEGLDTIFREAGFEWREAGCSMCLAMNDDVVPPEGRCASTSNRNFEGRQGNGARTHLVSPEMAAVAAIKGHFDDVRNYLGVLQ